MIKQLWHKLWTKLGSVKPLYFVVIALISTATCVIALRVNNEHMIKLRSAVYTADKSNVNIEAALQNLQAYVTNNMNTNLSSGAGSVYPPLQLKYTYARLEAAQGSTVSTSNGQLYTDAQNYCQQLDPLDFSGHNRVPCIEQYVETHSAQASSIPTALYEFDFISPTWSPDLAGWALVVAILSWLMAIIMFVINKWFRAYT
jgi:hypothetical protein